MRPIRKASRSASVSTVLPRPALTKSAPGFIRARKAASTNFSVSGVSGSRSTTSSARGSSFGSSDAGFTPSRAFRATPMTCAANGASRAARARPIDPYPTTSTVWPSMSSIFPSSPGPRFHSASRWYSMNFGKRRCIARMEATTHSATGMSCTPTALHTTTPAGTLGNSQSTPALSDCTTRSPGSSSKRPGSRLAMSKLMMTNSTSGPGSATSWTPSGSGSSSRLSGPSGTRTFNTGLLCGSLGGGALLERELQNFFDSPGEVERHLLADALGDVVQVLLIALRENDLLQAHSVSGQHLLLDAADGQHQTLQRDLAGHADRAPNRATREQANDRGRHRHAGRRTVLGHSARGHVDVKRLLDRVGLDPQLSRVRPHIRERDLRRLLHLVAQLAGEEEAALALRGSGGRRFDEQHVSANSGHGEACGHAWHRRPSGNLVVELGLAQELAHPLLRDLDRWRQRPRRDLGCDLASDLPELALEVPHAGLARVVGDYCHDCFIGYGDLVVLQSCLLDLALHQVVLRDRDLLLLRVAVEPDELHAVQQGRRDRLRHVGGRDEQHLGQVEVDLQVVVAERVVLRWVEHVEHDHRVLGPGFFQGAHDPARKRPDVGAPVAADVRLVADSAQGHARELAAQRAGDRFAQRGLAGSGRADQGDDRARALGRKFTRVSLGGIRDEDPPRFHEVVVVFGPHVP